MSWSIDSAFDMPANDEVLAYLRRANPSAHSDVASELHLASQGVPAARWYCPDPGAYAFVALHRDDHNLVAVALGMGLIVFRLPIARIEAAVQDGGARFPEIGPDWVSFNAFTDEPLAETRRRLGRWCRIALDTDTGRRTG